MCSRPIWNDETKRFVCLSTLLLSALEHDFPQLATVVSTRCHCAEGYGSDSASARLEDDMNTNLDPQLLERMDAYWRAANYLSVGQLYPQISPDEEA